MKLNALDFSKAETTEDEMLYYGVWGFDNNVYAKWLDRNPEDSANVTFTVRVGGHTGSVVYNETAINTLEREFAYNINASYNSTSLYCTIEYVTAEYGTGRSRAVIKNNDEKALGIDFEFFDLQWAILIFLSFVALIFTVSTADIGAIVFLGAAVLTMRFGWLELSYVVVGVSFALAIMNLLRKGERGVL